MTKQNKTICLDIENIEKLNKTESASKLINELLIEYFNSTGDLKEAELKKKSNETKNKIDELQTDLKEVNKQLKQLEKDKERVKEVYKEIPKEILEDFKSFRDMDIHTLRDRFNSYYSEKYNDLNLNEIEKAFKEFRGIKDG